MSPGPPPKTPSRRIRTTTKSVGILKAAGVAPRIPKGLCTPAQDAWRGYWGDVASGVMRGSDTVVALRWIANVDRYHRLIAEADREPIVVGSTGQPRGNPAYDLAYKVEASIKDDERQLGIGPLNRLRLGVALSETAKTLSQINAEAQDDAEKDDPRTKLTVVADDSP